MHNHSSGRAAHFATAGLLLLLTSGCGTAMHYDPQVATEESIAANRKSEREHEKATSALSHRRDAVSQERTRWSKLTKEGRTQLRVGNLGAAEQNYVAAAAIAADFRKRDRRRHAGIGNLKRLAYAYQAQGQDIAFTRVAQVIRLETMGESETEVPGLTDLLIDLGTVYLAQDNPEAAQEVLGQALALRIQREGAQSMSLAPIYRSLAQAAHVQENYDAAEEFSRSRLALAESSTRDPNIELIRAQLQLGQILLSQKKYPAAESYFDSALAARERLDDEPAEIILIQNALAEIYRETDRLQFAQKTIDKAIASAEKLGVSGIFLANLIDTRAQVLADRGHPKDADAAFRKAIQTSTGAPKSQQVVLLENYSAFLEARNRTQEMSAIQAQIDALNADVEATKSGDSSLDDGPAWEKTAGTQS